MLFERLLLAASYSTSLPSVMYSLFGVGSNGSYQLGNGTTTDLTTITQIGAITSWTKIFAGNGSYGGSGTGSRTTCQSLSFGIQSDNSLWTWGSNVSGATGLGLTTGFTTTPTKVGTSSWSTVAACVSGASTNFTLAIQTNGTLWAWGNNSNNQLGIAGGPFSTPQQVGVATTWTQIACNGDQYAVTQFAVGLQSNGTLWSTGSNTGGATGQGTYTGNTTTFTQIGAGTTWAQVSCGCAGANDGGGSVDTTFTLAIQTNGTLWAWGNNSAYQLGDGTTTNHNTPVQIGAGTTWKYVYAGNQGASFAIQTNGTLWAWGWNFSGQTGLGISSYSFTHTPTQVGSATNWIQVANGSGNDGAAFSIGLQSNGTLWAWGVDASYNLGQGTAGTSLLVPTLIPSTSLFYGCAAGGDSYNSSGETDYTLALQLAVAAGTLFSFGPNLQGATGQNTNSGNSLTPKALVDGHTTWSKICVGGAGSATNGSGCLGLLSNGTLWSWGCNFLGGSPASISGSIGQGNNANPYYVPTQVGSGTTWSDIAMSIYGGLAIQSNGTLWSFGSDGFRNLGQLGAITYIPTQVGVGTTWSKVFTGSSGTTYLIDTSGQLWGMGQNTYYQLGLGNTLTPINAPTQIGVATNWVMVAAGAYGAIGIQSNGTAWSWGTDINGELCQGSAGGVFHVPTQIGVGTNWVFAASDSYFAYFTFLIKNVAGVRTLWTAGSNANYATGLGTSAGNTTTLTQVGSATNWLSVTCLNDSTTTNPAAVAIRTDGTAWSWGTNANGQTGQGTTSGTTNNPTQIGVATNWINLSYTTSSNVVVLTN